MTRNDAARDLANLAVRAANVLQTLGVKELARELLEAVQVFDNHDD